MKTLYCNEGGTLDLIDSGEYVLITRLRVLPRFRGRGHGRDLMNQVLQDADHEEKTLVLHIVPDDEGDFDRLVLFYESFGFVRQEDGLYQRNPCSLQKTTTAK